jgi:hypothetical protein
MQRAAAVFCRERMLCCTQIEENLAILEYRCLIVFRKELHDRCSNLFR